MKTNKTGPLDTIAFDDDEDEDVSGSDLANGEVEVGNARQLSTSVTSLPQLELLKTTD